MNKKNNDLNTEKGKLYYCNGTIVLCTGEGVGSSLKVFSGTVIKSTDTFYKIGDHSENWSKDTFIECDEKIKIQWILI